MQKKITIFTLTSVTNPELSRSFTTKRLAEDAQETLKAFGVESEVTKENKIITL